MPKDVFLIAALIVIYLVLVFVKNIVLILAKNHVMVIVDRIAIWTARINVQIIATNNVEMDVKAAADTIAPLIVDRVVKYYVESRAKILVTILVRLIAMALVYTVVSDAPECHT